MTSRCPVPLAQVKSFISGVTSRMTARSHLLRGALSGHPPSPNTSRERQQTGSPEHCPLRGTCSPSSVSCICLGSIPQLPDSSYAHYRFGKALGTTELYSNQSLALEEGWIKVCFTVLYQRFFMSFETGQCLFSLEHRYSEGFNSATSIPPSKECDEAASDCAVFLYCF